MQRVQLEPQPPNSSATAQPPASQQRHPPPRSWASTPSSHRALRKTPKFDAAQSPQPRQTHIHPPPPGFPPLVPFATRVDEQKSSLQPSFKQRAARAHRELDPAENDNDDNYDQLRGRHEHPDTRSARRRSEAVVLAIESLRQPNSSFTPDLIEEFAPNPLFDVGTPPMPMAESRGPGPATQSSTARARTNTGGPAHIRSPREVWKDRQARMAADQQERDAEERMRADERRRAEDEARQMDELKRRRERQPTAPAPAPAAGPSTQPQQDTYRDAPAHEPGTAKPRTNFPHAFERWETLSSHWEALTTFWVRKMDAHKDEISSEPLSVQLRRQVTDLSAAGANLFHAVVELQRLRASSERKFTRWFFETRSELERLREENAKLEADLEAERRGRGDELARLLSEAPREQQPREQQNSVQVMELRKELGISKEEARRAWEELGRMEQRERDWVMSLQAGKATVILGVPVVPMTQGVPQRHQSASSSRAGYPDHQSPKLPARIRTGAAGAALSKHGPPLPATQPGAPRAGKLRQRRLRGSIQTQARRQRHGFRRQRR